MDAYRLIAGQGGTAGAMSKTRNNHYVPQWYQEGFFEPGRTSLAYLDLNPPTHQLADGQTVTGRALFDAPTARAFRQRDLYSTFFDTTVNDEIERRLFGSIDATGSAAFRAFATDDQEAWHDHFKDLFTYIDIQKVRTPKGLDWLRARYPELSQNELMFEMQGIRAMHCSIWAEGVRELVSAEEAGIKFLVTDHPVTIYNHAAPPGHRLCGYPEDPWIALKASQTLFPLNRDWCLILTNLEYAKDPATAPLEKRTFARNYRHGLVRTDAFIRERKLKDAEVARINFILKARARRYIAAGREEWLYPERSVTGAWADLSETLLPKDGLWHFEGELFVRYEDGHVHYQDAFGRTEKPRDELKKVPPAKIRPGDPCGCGSGRRFKTCCKDRSAALRPSWDERSIRERNFFLVQAIGKILKLNESRDWVDVRSNLTDDQIAEVYLVYEMLWPRETDLLQLLPKPDGRARAVYTGSLHPDAICDFALGASLYFGELIIQSPFVHAGSMAEAYSPVANPRLYRQEFLKSLLFFFTVMPLVEIGLVNLIPDPCDFDPHLRDQMMHMARARSAGMETLMHRERRAKDLAEQDFRRSLMALPRDVLREQLRESSPDLDDAKAEKVLDSIERLRRRDPLAVLQEGSLSAEDGGQLSLMRLAPNFEIAMYLAQATGACIVTDSPVRWDELRMVHRQAKDDPGPALGNLQQAVQAADFLFPGHTDAIWPLAADSSVAAFQGVMRDAFKYLNSRAVRGAKPNLEANLAARFRRAHGALQKTIGGNSDGFNKGRLSCAFPTRGLQHHTVNRLLLMSSSEHHLPRVPMAFFIGDPPA